MSTQSNSSSKEPTAGLPEWALEMLMRREPPSDLGLWTPPDDPDKPALPYVPGFTTRIHRHVAPPFFFDSYRGGKEPRPLLSDEYLKTVTQSRAIVDNPPIETSPTVQSETAQLTVTAPLAIGASRGPQVVCCSVTRQIKTKDEVKTVEAFHAVAKIFGPLYYSFRRSIGNYPRDCICTCELLVSQEHRESTTTPRGAFPQYFEFLSNLQELDEADEGYSAEAAAYDDLQKAGQTRSFTPEYYGSWTFSLPINIDGNHYTRPIRLILVEQLNGTSAPRVPAPAPAIENKPPNVGVQGRGPHQPAAKSHQTDHPDRASAAMGNAARNEVTPRPSTTTSGGGCSICKKSICTFNPDEPLIEISGPNPVTFSTAPGPSNFIPSQLLGEGVNLLIKLTAVKLSNCPPISMVQPSTGHSQNSKVPAPALLQQRCVVSGSHAEPPATNTTEADLKN